MNSVSLICTIHGEVGCASAPTLATILESIQPDVIFVEVPAAAFNDFYRDRSRQNLESLAVKSYQEGRNIEIVPVDLPTPDQQFFDDEAEFENRIRAESPTYRDLKRQERSHVERYSFAYLNSEYYNQLCVDLYSEMEATLERLSDPRLTENYLKWRETLSQRETAMLKNIQEYDADRSYNAVFLVGAAHRKYIIEKLANLISDGMRNIHWKFPECRA